MSHEPDPEAVPQHDQPPAPRGLRFVALAVLGGSGLVIYMAMWIIAPKQP